jgi:ABC-2 type transport system ATP-binding protein
MIEARGLTRRFDGFTAVEDVSLRVPDGTVLALLGPNGAGKTTTVRMLSGLIAPSAGEADVAGYDVRTHAAAVRARVGLVTDVPGLHEQMTVGPYLDFYGSLYGLARDARQSRIAAMLAFFELDTHRRERMTGFSKGMKQKVALARALLHEPAALFLDEPTSGLDPLTARSVRELIVSLKHASRSIILCTHDLDEAERLADQVAIMRRGRIVACDTPTALRAQASPLTTVRIELAERCPGALATLRAVEGASETADTSDGLRLEYRAAHPAEVNPRTLERLVAAGARVVSVTCERRTLEDVYAEVVAGSTGAAREATPASVAVGGERE